MKITQHLKEPITEREQDLANKLFNAALFRDIATIERMLSKSKTIKSLVLRGVLEVK